METKTSKQRFFSVELKAKSDLKSVSIPDGSHEDVVVEGTIGELLQIGFTEGIILDVIGERGILRIDISKDEVTRATNEDVHECLKKGDASAKETAGR